MKKESIIEKIKRFNEDISNEIPENLSAFRKFVLFCDFMIEYKFHGVYLIDYLQYKLYSKKRIARKDYVVHGKLIEMMKICNNPEHRVYFDEKPRFNKAFKEFLHRDWIYMEDATEEEFREFLKDRDNFFVKVPDGMFGLGVQKIFVKDIEDISALYNELKAKKSLCEETLTQCREFEEFNDSSINTLRVVTLMDKDGQVHVMGGLLRLGRKGKIADNFHYNGIASFIDPRSGIICTTGIDKDKSRHVIHPDSQKQIVGFQVPHWDDVVKTVTKAANVFPDMRYIGWDVVINKDYDIVLVEGNPGADPDAEQITTCEGRWPYYYKYLKDMK